jgi:hypothetical protein
MNTPMDADSVLQSTLRNVSGAAYSSSNRALTTVIKIFRSMGRSA